MPHPRPPAAPADTLSGDATLELPEFEQPPGDPLLLMNQWLRNAAERRVREPLAMVLATSAADARPSSRIVLAKGLDDRGVVFGSHSTSRKGRELLAVPHAAGSLYWRETLQQINIAGPVERLTDEESDALFAARPPEAQATTVVSQQSEPLLDPAAQRLAAAALRGGGSIPRPPDWSGYRLIIERIEFWHGSPDRLHRRLEYSRTASGWSHARLQP
jgi:pyridoxamine-phosphate oxidase